MKRVIKQTSRKGFTLVETLLATFILVVISTMLINGFIATMGYSYQTSVYSKSGANNYSACMDKLAEWNTLKDRGTSGRQSKLAGASTKNLTFSCPAGYSLEPLYVEVVSKTTLDSTVPGTLPFQDAAYAPKNDDLVDNRKTIIYYPEYWRASADSSKYKIAIRIDTENQTDGKPTYEWVVLPAYEVDEDYDLGSLGSSDIIGRVGGNHRTFGDNTDSSNNTNATSGS